MNKVGLTVACIAALATVPASGQDQGWNQTLERISSAVVSIRVDSTRAFDTSATSRARRPASSWMPSAG